MGAPHRAARGGERRSDVSEVFATGASYASDGFVARARSGFYGQAMSRYASHASRQGSHGGLAARALALLFVVGGNGYESYVEDVEVHERGKDTREWVGTAAKTRTKGL